MTRHRSPVLRVFSAAATALLLLAILGPFFQVLQGALFPQGTGFSLEAVYKVFLATPEYLLVFWRTIALCALMVGGQVVLSVLAGLGFAKYDFPGKNLWFFLLLVVMVLPLQVTLVPNFRILGTVNLLDTQWALVLPALFAPLGTFLMTQNFRAVPDEILEAAQLDGASTFTILWRILVPCGKNSLACVIVLTFLEAWNMVEQPMAYLKKPTQYPLSVSLATTGARDPAVQLACCLLALLPPLLLFLGLHKELVQGIALQEDWAGESPHRGFFRALAVALVVLTECTLLSTAVSREMAVEAVTDRPRYDRELGIQSLPLDAFHQEEDSTFLYLLEEGGGLLGSTQLRRVATDILSVEGDRAFTTGLEEQGAYVVYASRPLEDETLAVETVSGDPAPDTYLLWAPEGVGLDALSTSVEGGRSVPVVPRRSIPTLPGRTGVGGPAPRGGAGTLPPVQPGGCGTVRPPDAAAGGGGGADLDAPGVLCRAVFIHRKAGQGEGKSPVVPAPCCQPGRAVPAPAKGGAPRLPDASGDHLRPGVLQRDIAEAGKWPVRFFG